VHKKFGLFASKPLSAGSRSSSGVPGRPRTGPPGLPFRGHYVRTEGAHERSPLDSWRTFTKNSGSRKLGSQLVRTLVPFLNLTDSRTRFQSLYIVTENVKAKLTVRTDKGNPRAEIQAVHLIPLTRSGRPHPRRSATPHSIV